MRSTREIQNQLAHLQNGECKSDQTTRETWTAALEWVLATNDPLEPATDGAKPFGRLITAAISAKSALRSYQYGNVAPDLAEEIADELDSAIRATLDDRDDGIKAAQAWLRNIEEVCEEIKAKVAKPNS